MAIGLAEAGYDIIVIYIVDPVATMERISVTGRRFLGLKADLSDINAIPALLEQAVTEMGHIDILVNNAGIIRREDAITFNENGLG